MKIIEGKSISQLMRLVPFVNVLPSKSAYYISRRSKIKFSSSICWRIKKFKQKNIPSWVRFCFFLGAAPSTDNIRLYPQIYVFFTFCRVLLSIVEFLSFEFLAFNTKFMLAALWFGHGGRNVEPPSEFKEVSVNLQTYNNLIHAYYINNILTKSRILQKLYMQHYFTFSETH